MSGVVYAHLLAFWSSAELHTVDRAEQRAADASQGRAGIRKLRDFILFPKGPFTALSSTKDNTGTQHFNNRLLYSM